MTRKIVLLLPLASALLLAACGRNAPEEAPAEAEVSPVAVEAAPPVEEEAPPAPVAPVTNSANVAEAPAPLPEISEEQQMLDDAEASGMTARLPGGGTAADNSVPAEGADSQ